ncbi:MAG: hypothetical protein JW829_18615, partial [Pirellulales bacterium]|nr:hypothetical protein [Pirellulales bacterium]
APAVQDSESGPVTLILDKRGMSGIETLEPFLERAARGEVIIFPDIRFSGVYHLESLAGIIGPDMVRYNIASNFPAYTRPEEQRQYLLWAWERNSVVWGRPLVTMAVSDIQGILNTLQQVSRPKMDSVRVQARGSAHLALAAVFAAILDERISELDIDLCDARYDAYRYWHEAPDELPVLPMILRYGDVPQWLGAISDRNVVVRHLEASTEEINWLRRFFEADANAKGLCIE